MAHQLKYDIAKFSAFKETSFKEQVEAALVNNGRIRSWSEFKAAAKELGIQYNQRWLKTEYNQTVAQAQSVEKWKQIEADQDLYPNLEYKTIGDKRVRDEHKDWNGLIRPVNDPFWQTHLPPNDWGCRCYVKQTIEDVNRPNESFTPPKEDFAHNPAMSGKVFKENAYKKGLNEAEINDSETNVVNWELKEKVKSFTSKTLSEGIVRNHTTILGKLPEFVKNRISNLQNDFVMLTDKTILKYKTHPKINKGSSLQLSKFDILPEIIINPDNIYIDKSNSDKISYAFTRNYSDDMVIKVIVQPNYKLGKMIINNAKSIGVVKAHHMNESYYTKIK